MITNEDIREFELIERPVSPNKHNSSYSSSTIVKMWVLLEGSLNAKKLIADISKTEDLDDFKYIIKDEFKTKLENVEPENIILLDNDKLLRPSTDIRTLVTTDEKPLIVRYPISSANLKISYKFGNHKLYECELPHSSGSFNLLKKAVIEKHNELKTENFYFTYGADKGKEGLQIENEYNFNTLVSRCKLNNDNDCVISTLKVVEKGKKSFSSWNLKEAFSEILKNNYMTLGDLPTLDMEEDFAPLEHDFGNEELKVFVQELHRYLKVLNKEVSTNEQTSRAYINVFITTAISHIKDIKNKKSLRLCMESSLNGTRGTGPLDYVVKLGKILVLIIEAKAEEMNQGIAQAFVQAFTLMEELLKSLNNPITYGIVTNGKLWRFFRWTGSLNEPVVHITEEFSCRLNINDDDMIAEKEILRYIARILQVQVDAYGEDERPSKRVKIE